MLNQHLILLSPFYTLQSKVTIIPSDMQESLTSHFCCTECRVVEQLVVVVVYYLEFSVYYSILS